MTTKELIFALSKIPEDMLDVDVVLDVDEDSLRHLNVSEVVCGDKVVIIAADLSCK